MEHFVRLLQKTSRQSEKTGIREKMFSEWCFLRRQTANSCLHVGETCIGLVSCLKEKVCIAEE